MSKTTKLTLNLSEEFITRIVKDGSLLSMGDIMALRDLIINSLLTGEPPEEPVKMEKIHPTGEIDKISMNVWSKQCEIIDWINEHNKKEMK